MPKMNVRRNDMHSVQMSAFSSNYFLLSTLFHFKYADQLELVNADTDQLELVNAAECWTPNGQKVLIKFLPQHSQGIY